MSDEPQHPIGSDGSERPLRLPMQLNPVEFTEEVSTGNGLSDKAPTIADESGSQVPKLDVWTRLQVRSICSISFISQHI